MAGIVGEVASIAGLISLSVQLFDGCVKGFVILSAAQELGSRGDVLRCQLDWEHYLLNNWAKTVGLFKDPPELSISFSLINIVQRTLANLEQLLTDATRLREDYGLDVTITEEEINEVQGPKRFFTRILDKTKPQFVNDTAKVYSRRNGAWKKIKWASFDAERFRLLLKDIRYFNQRLLGLLHPIEQGLSTSDGNAVMRSIVAQVPDQALLKVISGPLDTVDGAVAACARLKQKGLVLQLLEQSSPWSSGTTTPTSRTLSVTPGSKHKASPMRGAKDLRRDSNLLSQCQGQSSFAFSREVAKYNGNAVIVEWKDVDRAFEPKLRYRIANVASLLAEMKDPAFHSLSCLGYLKVPKSGRYAYLFEPPAALMTADFIMKSLKDLYAQPLQRPSLNQRLNIAIALAETVLQLHTSGWLHKGIRPENVLFFGTCPAEWESNGDVPPAYLGGYEYARADNPLETTEAPSSRRHSEMYRHPLSLGHGRNSFTKRFDLYSLGCVLLELGFWTPLETILLRWLRHSSNESSDLPAEVSTAMAIAPENDAEYFAMIGEKGRLLQETGRGSIRAELEFRMGMAYSQVVMSCLHAKTCPDETVYEELDDSLDVQEEVLATLKNLNTVM